MEREQIEARISDLSARKLQLFDEQYKNSIRLEEITTQQRALADEISAVHGAIQDCEYWLKEVDNAGPGNVSD